MITDKRLGMRPRDEKKAKKNVHDHSATRGKRKHFYTVHCEKHGKMYSHSVEKVVVVPEGAIGCPLCIAERKA